MKRLLNWLAAEEPLPFALHAILASIIYSAVLGGLFGLLTGGLSWAAIWRAMLFFFFGLGGAMIVVAGLLPWLTKIRPDEALGYAAFLYYGTLILGRIVAWLVGVTPDLDVYGIAFIILAEAACIYWMKQHPKVKIFKDGKLVETDE